MLFGAHIGELELRASSSGGARLAGSFPYDTMATLSDGGRTGQPRKETIASRAFAYRVNDQSQNIHLLVGHSYDKPLASRTAGTLSVADSEDAVTFDATILPEIVDTSYGADTLALVKAGLAAGLSPGFRIPPQRAVKVAEELRQEEHDPANGKFRAIIRRVLHALLFELSIVTVPAYDQAQVEMRSWDLINPPESHLRKALTQWRV